MKAMPTWEGLATDAKETAAGGNKTAVHGKQGGRNITNVCLKTYENSILNEYDINEHTENQYRI